MLSKDNSQLTFDAIPFLKVVYDPEHPLMQLEKTIRWDALLEALGAYYSEDEGRPTIALRAKVGTLILKFVKNLSDRKIVRDVEENLYAQHFCGLTPDQARGYMCAESGLSDFRRQIGPEGMALVEAVLNAVAEKKPLKRGNKIIIDTTCVPLDIRYPTDIKLLERCRREVLLLIKKAKGYGVEASYRTYARVAKKMYTLFAKLSKPKAKTRKKVHKQMIQFVRRNLKQLTDLRAQCTPALGPGVGDETNPRRFEIHRFLKRLKESEQKIGIILHQQKQIYGGNLHLAGRIVSFHKDHVRPIMRGKFPVSTEFGPKVLLAVVRGYAYVVNTFQDNVSDTRMTVPALRWFKGKFGKFPWELLADRGMWKRAAAKWLSHAGIGCGIQVKGKEVPDTSVTRRQIRQRLPIEARISLNKRCFGWDRCRARNDEHEESWIRLGTAAMNVHLAYGGSP